MHTYIADWKGGGKAFQGGLYQCLAQASLWVESRPNSLVVIAQARPHQKYAQILLEVSKNGCVRVLGGDYYRIRKLRRRLING